MKLRSRDLTILRLNIFTALPQPSSLANKKSSIRARFLEPNSFHQQAPAKQTLPLPSSALPEQDPSFLPFLFTSACSSPTDRTHHTYHCTTSTIRIFPRSRWLKPTNRSHNSSWCLWVMEVPERSAPASRRLGLVPPVWVV